MHGERELTYRDLGDRQKQFRAQGLAGICGAPTLKRSHCSGSGVGPANV